jgi:hypothetical protein
MASAYTIPEFCNGDIVKVRGRAVRGGNLNDPLDQGTLIPVGTEVVFVERAAAQTTIVFGGVQLVISNGYLELANPTR